MTNPIFDRIQKDLNENNIVLFMKGTAEMPQCGFSSVVVQILNHLGVEFKDIDILQDPELRQGIKDFNNWPTIPQLFVKGEFIGGADIAREMYQSGELQKLFEEKGLIAA